MDPVRLEYDLDADTAVAATLAYQAADPGPAAALAVARRRNVVAGLFVAGLFGGLYLARAPGDLSTWLGVTLGLLFAYANAASWKRRQGTALLLRRLLRDPAGAAGLGRRTVEFTRTRLVLHTEYSREEFAWPAVLRVKHTPEFLLLTLPGPRPVAVPRSAFPTAEAFDRMVDELRACTGVTV